jgi:hypothetical protein
MREQRYCASELGEAGEGIEPSHTGIACPSPCHLATPPDDSALLLIAPKTTMNPGQGLEPRISWHKKTRRVTNYTTRETDAASRL